MQEYSTYAAKKVKRNCDELQQLLRRYSMLLSIFDVEFEDMPSFTGESVMIIDTNTLKFTPTKVTSERIWTEQKEHFLLSRQLWREHAGIHVIVDLSEMTLGFMTDLIRNSSTKDMSNGLECWATIPCPILSIELLAPRSFPGWKAVSLIGMRMMSSKLRQRTVITEFDSS